MHELSVTQGLLKICLEEGKKHNINRIKELNIKVGELTDLVPNCISYYFSFTIEKSICTYQLMPCLQLPQYVHVNACISEFLLHLLPFFHKLLFQLLFHNKAQWNEHKHPVYIFFICYIFSKINKDEIFSTFI